MDQLSGILLHMNLMDSDFLLSCPRFNLYLTIAADRQIQLGNLIILRIIRIKIILTVKFTILGNRAVRSKSDRYGIFEYLFIQYG